MNDAFQWLVIAAICCRLAWLELVVHRVDYRIIIANRAAIKALYQKLFKVDPPDITL